VDIDTLELSGTKHYSAAEYSVLCEHPEKKAEVDRLRDEAKAAGFKIGAVRTEQPRKVAKEAVLRAKELQIKSGVKWTAKKEAAHQLMLASDSEGEDDADDKEPTKNAGEQFGSRGGGSRGKKPKSPG
jgi:hypothetical protein